MTVIIRKEEVIRIKMMNKKVVKMKIKINSKVILKIAFRTTSESKTNPIK